MDLSRVDTPFTLAVLTLLHVLAFVYWLGGDLGAFYASHILTDAKRPTPARIAAAQVLATVDMAPRTALILTAPTGLSVAAAKGWIVVPIFGLIGVWAVGLAWLALAWMLHLTHAPPHSLWRKLDLGVRWAAIGGLAAFAGGAFGPAPLFLQLKAVLLGGAVLLGLSIRAALKPFGPAFAALAQHNATSETNASITACLARARPLVLCIWLLLLCAAFLGIAKPIYPSHF
jgi:hypothetical protein